MSTVNLSSGGGDRREQSGNGWWQDAAKVGAALALLGVGQTAFAWSWPWESSKTAPGVAGGKVDYQAVYNAIAAKLENLDYDDGS
jgi:hypothetical protein